MASTRLKKRVFGVVCVCVSFALVAQLLGRIDLDRTALILQRADWRWLAAAPNYPMNYYNFGVAKFCLKDMRGAIDSFSQAINLKPQTAWFRFNRGLAKCSSGDIVGGIADLTKAIELNPKYVEAHILRGKAKGGFVKGCYNPLNDPELLSIFEGDLDSLKKEIAELENSFLLNYLDKS